MKIKLATAENLDKFFVYLNDHLSDNGDEKTCLFQPMSRKESCLNESMKARFTQGIELAIGEQGWRRLWLAFDENLHIVGHIDIRSHPEKHTEHRAMLGMGVDRMVRRRGLGRKLLGEMNRWVASESDIEYIDLWVLSNNAAAQKLYLRSGFDKCGEITDMFRIEGQSLGYVLMSKAAI